MSRLICASESWDDADWDPCAQIEARALRYHRGLPRPHSRTFFICFQRTSADTVLSFAGDDHEEGQRCRQALDRVPPVIITRIKTLPRIRLLPLLLHSSLSSVSLSRRQSPCSLDSVHPLGKSVHPRSLRLPQLRSQSSRAFLERRRRREGVDRMGEERRSKLRGGVGVREVDGGEGILGERDRKSVV